MDTRKPAVAAARSATHDAAYGLPAAVLAVLLLARATGFLTGSAPQLAIFYCFAVAYTCLATMLFARLRWLSSGPDRWLGMLASVWTGVIAAVLLHG